MSRAKFQLSPIQHQSSSGQAAHNEKSAQLKLTPLLLVPRPESLSMDICAACVYSQPVSRERGVVHADRRVNKIFFNAFAETFASCHEMTPQG